VPPDVAWLLPELDVGAEPELNPLEFEFELELEPVELEPEPVEEEPDEVEPEPDEPVDELEDEPELVEVPVDEEAVLWVDPGRPSATMPAAATLAKVTVVVADRTLARPSSLAAVARRMRSRCASLMYLIVRSRTRCLLHEPSRLAMSWTAHSTWDGRYPANMKAS
jgi:hypothetical protein